MTSVAVVVDTEKENRAVVVATETETNRTTTMTKPSASPFTTTDHTAEENDIAVAAADEPSMAVTTEEGTDNSPTTEQPPELPQKTNEENVPDGTKHDDNDNTDSRKKDSAADQDAVMAEKEDNDINGMKNDSNNDDNNNNNNNNSTTENHQETDTSRKNETTMDETDKATATNDTDAATTAAVVPDIDIARPVKRARTAYFLFMEEKRPEVQAKHAGAGVAIVAKALGQLWGTLSEEDKAPYRTRAAAERTAVAAATELWKRAGGVVVDPSSRRCSTTTSSTTHGPLAVDTLVFPVARIRKICKLDPDVRGLSKEAVVLVTKAAQLATQRLGHEAWTVAQIQNRRTVQCRDVAHVAGKRENFAFLKEDLRDVVREQAELAVAHKQQQQQQKDTTAAVGKDAEAARMSKPLTDYFAAKKE